MDESNGGQNRPYPPPSNVIAVLHRIRTRNPPERIDTEYLRDIGIPDGSIHRTAFALRFLGLVEGEQPTAALRAVATSTDEEYQEILQGLIEDKYKDVLTVVDPGTDGQDRIANVFKKYTPASQRNRMVIFFLGMCREAGMPVHDAPRERTSGAMPGAQRSKQPGRSKPTAKPTQARPAQRRQADEDVAGIPAALLGLLRMLPSEGSPLPEPRRKQWLSTADAMLTFMYPEDAPSGTAAGPSEEEYDEDEEAE
jgi:hypothetical protein